MRGWWLKQERCECLTVVHASPGSISYAVKVYFQRLRNPGLGNPGFSYIAIPTLAPADLSTVLCTPIHFHTEEGGRFVGAWGVSWGGGRVGGNL